MSGTLKNKRQSDLLWNQNTDSRLQPDAALKRLINRERKSQSFSIISLHPWMNLGGRTSTNMHVTNYWDFPYLSLPLLLRLLHPVIHFAPITTTHVVTNPASSICCPGFLSAAGPALLCHGRAHGSLKVPCWNWCKSALLGRARGCRHLLKLSHLFAKGTCRQNRARLWVSSFRKC